MYLLIANLSLCLMIGVYVLFLKNLTFFQWNRIYLLSALGLSYLLPLLHFIDLNRFKQISNSLITVSLPANDVIYLEEVVIGGPSASSGIDILTVIYFAGCAVVFTLWMFRVLRIRRLYKNGSTGTGSFSFFNYVYVDPGLDHHDEVLAHEHVHVRQKHSYDIFFVEWLRIFSWFNPVFIYLRRELKFQHECIVDQICGEENKSVYAELLLAHAMDVPVSVLTHEFANASVLKKRITMLFKNRSKKRSKLLYSAIVPCLVLVLSMILIIHPSISKQLEEEDLVDMMFRADQSGAEAIVQTQDTTEDFVFYETDVLAEPERGIDAFRKWLGNNYAYPAEAIENHVYGRVEVSFIVEKDGSLSSFKINRDLGYGTGDALVRVLKKSAKWKPAIQNGKAVRLAYTLPLDLQTFGGESKSKEISPVTIIGYSTAGRSVQQESPQKEEEATPPARLTLKGDSVSGLDRNPEPSMGLQEYRIWVGQNYVFPQEAIDAGVKGTIQVAFDIETDGTLNNVKVIKDLGHGTGKAALDVINKSEKWKPGMKDGKAVKTAFALPITLNLSR